MLDFVLAYTGKFVEDQTHLNYYDGVFKAQSQSFVTRINGNGTVNFDYKGLMGSVSVLTLEMVLGSTNQLVTVTGNLTFGIHQTHNDHTMLFKNEAEHALQNIDDKYYTTGCVLHVTQGFGAYKDARGTITLNMVIDFESGDSVIGAVGIMWVDQN
ncbi:hypothetical protein QOT17_023042 [Balamuthia mandrillaris]